jgi:hypothetical protein
MQRIEINGKLSKDFLAIARGLKEIKETAYNVSLSAERICALLEKLKRTQEIAAEDVSMLDDAIRHYRIIASNLDAWPEITTEALASEESIRKLFFDIFSRLQDAAANQALRQRLQAYVWITCNIGALGKFLNAAILGTEDADIIHKNLYTPMQRMAKLKSFLESFKAALTQEDQDLLRPVIDELHAGTAELNEQANKLIPDTGEKMSQAAQLMLRKLDFFVPEYLKKANYEHELRDLKLTIKTVNFSGDFKPRLEELYHLMSANVIAQRLNGKSEKDISNSDAMKLCRHTQSMLDVVLSGKSTDDKLKAIQTFEKNTQTSGLVTALKILAAIVIAAVATVLVAAATMGVAAILGTFFGPPGIVTGAIGGLVDGVITGVGIGVAVAATVTGVALGSVFSYHTMFKTDPMTRVAKQVADEARTCEPLAAAPQFVGA